MSATIDEASWPSAGTDRRRHPRKYISGTGLLLLPGQRPVEVHTQDISLGGLGVIAPLPLPHEFVCSVRFALSKESYGMHFVTAPVRVAHCVLSGREYGFLLGLEFEPLPENVSAIVNKYMTAKGTTLGLGA